jgi:hypothetical protein
VRIIQGAQSDVLALRAGSPWALSYVLFNDPKVKWDEPCYTSIKGTSLAFHTEVLEVALLDCQDEFIWRWRTNERR